MPETAKRTARVPILGEDGRIPDDYIPAAIGEGVESAEAAATRAETAATAAEGSASAASQSATGAQGSASAASTSAAKAQESATAAGGAVTQAQSAQKAAEAAKTGAESARDSAKTAASKAQQSATAAADSAASVADKFITSAEATTLEPGSQATASVADQVLTLGIPRGDKGDKGDQGDKGDPGDVSAVQTAEGSDLSVSTDGGTVTIDDSALRARISELENQAANVLTGTSTGLVSHGEDAYAQKPIETRIKGRTVQNLWVNPSGTVNGVTVTDNSDGAVTLSGTNTSVVTVQAPVLSLKPNTTYYIDWDKDLPIGYFCVGINGGAAFRNSRGSFTTGSDTSNLVCAFVVPDKQGGVAFSGTYRVMLNEGSTAEPWCPPGLNSVGEDGSVDIVTAGKNLLSFAKGQRTLNGVTFSVGDDGSIKFSGTATARATFQDKGYLVQGAYVLSGARDGDCNVFISYRDVDNTPRYIDGYSVSSGVVAFTLKQSTTVHFHMDVRNAGSVDAVLYPQLELGSTATDYEPPNITTTPLPEVELRSLPNGTCDELVIKADGTCEVERRTGYIASYTDEEVTGEYVSTGNGLEAGASIVYELDEPTAEPQSPVTLPALPAPTFNQYHDADVPSDTSTEYARDINIVLDNLAKQVAGTASAVAVREASTIEEE